MLVAILIQLNLVALCALVFTAHKISRARRKYLFKPLNISTAADDLPSVSVCLPARNETGSMTECLESVLLSDYPKLEIIVLDDNSTDNTSNLIKAFAHSGVRFVRGDQLTEGWLGKNYALETLLGEASGRYVIFMDVDTRISRNTISQVVETALASGSDMLSVIPQRYDTYRVSSWMGTLRYFWEMVLDSKRRPGSSPAFWFVRRRRLIEEMHGFQPWRDQVQPEMHIAKQFLSSHSYSLAISTPALGVSFAKKWSSQIETGRRLSLPSFYNSTLAVLIGVGMLLTIILPQVAWLIAIFEGRWILFAIEFALGAVSAMVFASYLMLFWRNRWYIGVIFAPLVAWQELWLLVSSAIGYRVGTITWKGRPVARPQKN